MSVTWTDVAPRDGMQNLAEGPASAATTEVKVRLVRGLLDAGIPRVEATSFVSPRWVPLMADAAAVLAGLGADLARLRVLIPNVRGLELALASGVRNVVVTIAATDSFNRRNVNRSVEESVDELDSILATAADDCTVDVALSVAFGCPFEGWVDPEGVRRLCARLADLGCAEISVADTIGVAVPLQVTQLCGELLADLGEDHVALHVHDTRGLGVANVLAASEAGISRFEGSVGGLGGCPFAPRSTGNVCSEDALNALRAAGEDLGGIDLEALCAVAIRLGEDLGVALPGYLHRAGMWHPERLETAPLAAG
ncbi:MAG TPA: hydroxymethylglutaryl-CoA lyase [Candidatus Dormibacteraeota bacterium]